METQYHHPYFYVFKKVKQDHWAFFSFVILTFYILLALLAQWGFLASDFALTDYSKAYTSPSLHHWLGTDFFGRSVLSRAIQGVRIALIVGFFSSGLACFLGTFMGLLSGYFGKKVDDFIVWLYTTVDSIPSILLISAFVYCFGQGGLSHLYMALGLTSWVKLCRLIRAEVIRQKEKDYVASVQAIGASHFHIIFKHILPNVIHLVLIQFNLIFVFAVKVEVILSFLGIGLEPGTPSWGTMINDAKVELTRGIWWQLLGATTFMFFLILAMNILADSLRKALSPE